MCFPTRQRLDWAMVLSSRSPLLEPPVFPFFAASRSAGMVDHDTLHDAYARAGFILYPTAFPGEWAVPSDERTAKQAPPVLVGWAGGEPAPRLWGRRWSARDLSRSQLANCACRWPVGCRSLSLCSAFVVPMLLPERRLMMIRRVSGVETATSTKTA